MITLEDLLFITNDGTLIQLVNSDTQEFLNSEVIEAGDLEKSGSDYLEATVMDIVVGDNIMYIDLDI